MNPGGSLGGFGGIGESPFGTNGLNGISGIGGSPISNSFAPPTMGSDPFGGIGKNPFVGDGMNRSPFGESGFKSPYGDQLMPKSPFRDNEMMKTPFQQGPFSQHGSPFGSVMNPFCQKKESPPIDHDGEAKKKTAKKPECECEPAKPTPCPPPTEPAPCAPSPPPHRAEPCFESRKASLNRDPPRHVRRYAFVPTECRENTSPRYHC